MILFIPQLEDDDSSNNILRATEFPNNANRQQQQHSTSITPKLHIQQIYLEIFSCAPNFLGHVGKNLYNYLSRTTCNTTYYQSAELSYIDKI
jgi:hypothetical protein